MKMSSKRTLNKRQTAYFCSQLKMLLSSGVPLLSALSIASKAGKKKFYNMMPEVIEKLNNGLMLSEALVNYLPILAASSIKVGESNGSLEDALGQLAKYYEERAEIEEKLISALVYPAFIFCLSLVCLIGLAVFVLPGLSGVFADIGGELPLITRIILGSADLFAQLFPILIIGGLLASLVVWRRKADVASRLPFVGSIMKQEEIIQGLGTIGALLNTGTPIDKALQVAAETSRGRAFRSTILAARDKVINGEKLSSVLAAGQFFPPEMTDMLKVGENSGRLAEMFLSVSHYQAREREMSLKRLTALIEPVMTLSVGLFVGLVVMGIFLPLMNMISALN
ncbi:MAG: type II secretion system F family protein [Candidatus Margulisiibacteriota bacterium]